jgi:hypothetical protein
MELVLSGTIVRVPAAEIPEASIQASNKAIFIPYVLVARSVPSFESIHDPGKAD